MYTHVEGGDIMIVRFSFQNFRSYKNETTFDYQAASIPEFDETLIKRDKVSDLLPVSVVYGPNGGGKSNLLMALSYLISVVTRPILRLEKNRTAVFQQYLLNCSPFLFDDKSSQKPSEFDLYFRTEKNEFHYYLSIRDGMIVDECLYRRAYSGKKTAMIFERSRDAIELGAGIRSKSINVQVNPKMPYLSFLAINYDIDVIAEVQEWFESCIIRNFANPRAEQKVYLPQEEESQKLLVDVMNEMDIRISGFRMDEEHDHLYLQREINGQEFELDFNDESAGTQKMFTLMPLILRALSKGSLVVLDEMDAKLHPKLLRYIISQFKNPKSNPYGAQLIYTSHDLTTMNHNVFRRDEIWFAAINEQRESEIYSLYDFRTEDGSHVNQTASFSKQYLEGRYGADPYLRNMLEWGDQK